MNIRDVDLIGSERFGSGGFTQLLRCELQNRYENGTVSRRYFQDMLVRPHGADAVAVIPFQKKRGEVEVLLRSCLRPAVRLGRDGELARDGKQPPWFIVETVAGILEQVDRGDDGIRQRAVLELLEEAGLRVTLDAVFFLGPPMYSTPGFAPEQIFFCAAETDLERRENALGDGSPVEEGATFHLLTLADALKQCREGVIRDFKTEIILRRLADARLTDAR